MANERDLTSPFVLRHSGFVIGLLVLLPIAVLFGPALFTDRSFAMRDAAHFYHPLFEWTAKEWGQGRVPLWNPDENCGVPVVADASSSVFYPGKLVFALPLDFTLRYKLYVIGHVLLAAMGSFLLARHWKTSHFAAGVAALAYACGGNVVFQYCNVVFLVGAAWLPFATLAADRMLVQQCWRGAVGLGMVLALMILGGEPQAAYHALLITAIYAIVLSHKSAGQETKAGAGIWQWLKNSHIIRRILLTGLAASAGFLLAAVQISPSSEASKESERAAYRRPRSIYEVAAYLADVRAGHLPHVTHPAQEISRGLFGQPDPTTHHERAYYFSVGPWRYAELIWPNISGRMFPTERRWLSLWPAEGRIWTPTLYMGLLPILLAMSRLRLRRGDDRQRWLSWLVLLFTLGSLGWYGLGWIAREFCSIVLQMDTKNFPVGSQVGSVYWLMTTLLPTYVNFRYPAKLLVVAALALSQLSAFGWDRLFEEERKRFVAVLKWLGGASAVLLVIAWGAATWFGSILGPRSKDTPLKVELTKFLGKHTDPSLGPFDWRGSSLDVELAFLQTAAVCGILLWLLAKAWREPQQTAKWQLAALLLVALDLAAAHHWLVPTAPAAIWRDAPAAVERMKPAVPGEYSRVFRSNLGNWRPAAFGKQGSPQRMAEITEWERNSLFPKYGLKHSVALVESYGSLKSAHYESLLLVARGTARKQADGTQPMPNSSTLRLLGTQYLLLPDKYFPGPKDNPFAEKVAAAKPVAEGATLWQMKSTYPRAWIVHQVEILPPLSPRMDLDTLDARSSDVLFPFEPAIQLRTARDLATTAVVETHEASDLATISTSTERLVAKVERCELVSSEPTLVKLNVELARPGLVVLSETYAPGWIAHLHSATEDQAVQREVRMYRTNRVFRGVVVPAGRHVLTFTYQPASFYRGAAVSLVAWLGLGMMVAIGVIWRRRETKEELPLLSLKSDNSSPA